MRTISRKLDSPTLDECNFLTDESAPDFIVNSFGDWLAQYVTDGAEIADGHTLQYGYSLLRCQVTDRKLSLLAPDFVNMPIQWVSNLGPAFSLIAAHKYTPESFGFEPLIPSLRSSAVVGRRFDEIPLFANRMQPLESNPDDSGWFFGSQSDDVDNDDPEQLQLMSLYEVGIAIPDVLQFLSLPVNCQVVFSGGTPIVLQDFKVLPIPPDSYLDRLLNGI